MNYHSCELPVQPLSSINYLTLELWSIKKTHRYGNPHCKQHRKNAINMGLVHNNPLLSLYKLWYPRHWHRLQLNMTCVYWFVWVDLYKCVCICIYICISNMYICRRDKEINMWQQLNLLTGWVCVRRGIPCNSTNIITTKPIIHDASW